MAIGTRNYTDIANQHPYGLPFQAFFDPSDAHSFVYVVDPNHQNTALAIALNISAFTAGAQIATLQFPLASARAITSSDYDVVATTTFGSGGVLGSDATPKLIRTSTSTDPTATLTWAASSNIEVQWDFVAPLDMDVTQPATLNVVALMGGSMDTPTLTVTSFAGTGGTAIGGATQALSNTKATKTFAYAANVFTSGQEAMFSLTPGTHTNDTLIVRGVYLTYFNK